MKYTGLVGELLEAAGDAQGDVIEVKVGEVVQSGIMMPHHDFSSPSVITLKLPNGYNIGVNTGAAAGQTVFHLHVHLIPRYSGDVPDPRGGVRHVIPPPPRESPPHPQPAAR